MPALLSKLERDVMHPTLPTLFRIAMVFSVGLEYFFTSEPRPVLEIVRKKDRLRFPESPDGGHIAYYFESLDFPVPDRALNSYLAEFESMGSEDSRFHQHPGIELLYVLSGRLELRTGETDTSWRMETPFTSTALCRTATANSEASAPRRLWWCWKRQRDNFAQHAN